MHPPNLAARLADCSRIATVLALFLVACSGPGDLATSENTEALSPTNRWTFTPANGPFAFSADGTLVATGSGNHADILSAANGSLIRSVLTRGSPVSAAFSPDRSLLAVGSQATTLNRGMFRVSDGALLFEVTASANGTTGVKFSPTDPTIFVTAGRGRNTKVWNVNGTLLRTMNDGIRVLAMDI